MLSFTRVLFDVGVSLRLAFSRVAYVSYWMGKPQIQSCSSSNTYVSFKSKSQEVQYQRLSQRGPVHNQVLSFYYYQYSKF